MTDTDRLERFRGYFHTGEVPIATPDCLDADAIAALADGTMPGDARPHALQHLAGCAFCRRAVASVAAAIADGPVTHEIEMVEGRSHRGRRVLRIGVPLAAAAMVLVLLWSPADDRSPVHRGGAQAGPVPRLVAPIGAVAAVHELRWTSVVGADRYRLTLFHAAGAVLFETEGSDTLVSLPDSIRFIPSRPYLWKVEARTGWDRWSASELAEFTIVRGPPE